MSAEYVADSESLDVGNLVLGSALVKDLAFDPKPTPRLRWRLTVPAADGGSASRAIGFVITQRPGTTSPRIVEFVPGLVNYSSPVAEPEACDVEFIVAPLVQGILLLLLLIPLG